MKNVFSIITLIVGHNLHKNKVLSLTFSNTQRQYTINIRRISDPRKLKLKGVEMSLQRDTNVGGAFSSQNRPHPKKSKKVILIRHGCTYMNEYLSQPGCRWGDTGFTDVFSDEDIKSYRDSPLSKRGEAQAIGLLKASETQKILEDVEIIAVSPLTRTLQTMAIALLPHISAESRETSHAKAGTLKEKEIDNNEECCKEEKYQSDHVEIPIVALPLAAERLYLISDLGSSSSKLSKRYPYVDFKTEFHDKGEKWWFTVEDDDTCSAVNAADNNSKVHTLNEIKATFGCCERESEYKEWRPNAEGQTYACPGESQAFFNRRMTALYDWIDLREESTICLVSHWGVLECLTGAQFENCELRVINFEDIKRHYSE